MPPSSDPRHVSDVHALRALAHPVRQAIFELLVLRGAMTATQVGDVLDESPANCSWHLRKLAEHGFVEPAEGGTGRQRPWQAVSGGLRWGSEDDDDETRRASAATTRMMLDRERARLDVALERVRSDDPAWDNASSVTQSLIWLTPEELTQINETLHDIAVDRMDRIDDPSRRPPGSRLCSFVGWALPTYGLMEPTPRSDGADAGPDDPSTQED